MEGRSLSRTKFQLGNSPKACAQATTSPVGIVECDINYRSKGLLGHALSVLPQPTLSVGWLLVFLFVAPYLIATAGQLPAVLSLLSSGIASGLVPIGLLLLIGILFFAGLFEPSRIHLDQRGLRFVWQPDFLCTFGLIHWDNINSVSLEKARGPFGDEELIVIDAQASLSFLENACISFMRPLMVSPSQFRITLKRKLIPEYDFERLLGVLEAYIEPNKLSQDLHQKEDTSSDVIPYRAARGLHKPFTRLLERERQFAPLLVVISAVMAVPLLFLDNQLILYLGAAAVAVCVLLCLWIRCATWYRACELLIRRKGLQIRCRVSGKTFLLPQIDWQYLVSATIKKGHFSGEKNYLVLSADARMPLALKLIHLMLLRECKGWFSAWQLHFDFDCLSLPDRKELRRVLSQSMGRECIQMELSDALSPIDVGSYTTLWLQCLEKSGSELARSRQESLAQGTTLANDRYVVTGLVGAGGQGTAYLARSLENDQTVVLKEFILPAHGDLSTRQKALENVKREAELLKALNHPQIVGFVDFFIDDLRAYLVLKHIDGRSLRNLIKDEGRLSEQETIELANQMCDILQYLHSQTPPVVHRDFTPENLIITKNGKVTLIDFNVALQLESNTTRTVVGKHAYIPPEQFRGKASTVSDIYALGATLYFMLTGRDPEPITSSHPQSGSQSVSDELDQLVCAATKLDTDVRTQSADEMRLSLQKLARPPSKERHERRYKV